MASCYFRKNEGEVSEIFSVAGCLHRYENQHFLSACAFSDAAVNREYFTISYSIWISDFRVEDIAFLKFFSLHILIITE